MSRFLQDEMILRRTYTISDPACRVISRLSKVSGRGKSEILSVAVYNLVYDIMEYQMSNHCGLKRTVESMVDRLGRIDTYIEDIQYNDDSYRRTYSYSIIGRHMIDDLSMLMECRKSVLVDMAVMNMAYDVARIREGSRDGVAEVVFEIEGKIRTRPLESYISTDLGPTDKIRTVLDDFIFDGPLLDKD